MPPDHPPLAPEEHLAEANVHWTTSSTPSARTTRTCATPSGTAKTSSTPLGTADPSNLYHLPHLEEDPENLDSLNNRRGEEAECCHASTEKSTSSSTDMGRKKVRGKQKLNDRQILVVATGPPTPYRWSEHPINFTRAD
jgi:hypothetical protein